MENDKPPIHPSSGTGAGTTGGGLPPPSKNSSSSSMPAPGTGTGTGAGTGTGTGNQFNNEMNNKFSYDISRMSDSPHKRLLGHRRAHSEILSLPDDISFDSDLGVVGIVDGGPSLSDDTEEDLFSMYLDMEKFAAPTSVGAVVGAGCPSSSSTAESKSVDATCCFSVAPQLQPVSQGENLNSNVGGGGFNDRPRIRHQHSLSMDGSSSIKQELLISGSEGPSFTENKKAISSSKLADLALVDPKRAKRIWANRQSAARSKERKMRYISELERKVQTLQSESTTLATQLAMLQRDTTGLNAENNELKLRLHTMEQQVQLQDALNEALRDEVQRLKLMTGQNIAGAGPMMNLGPSQGPGQPFYPNNHAMQSLLAAHQFQQLQIHSQQSHHLQQLQQQHLQQLQQTGDMKLKGPLPSSSQRESSPDNNPPGNNARD